MRTEMKKRASAALMSSLKNRKGTLLCFWKKKEFAAVVSTLLATSIV